MNLAIVGTGFIADIYMEALTAYPQLAVVGAFDVVRQNAVRFRANHGIPVYDSLPELLENSGAELVLNLTNPYSHFEVSAACLDAGKHVYSEKPLAMKFAEAEKLIDLASARNCRIASAPCTMLSESSQTLAKALQDQVIGDVRLVYAECDEGMIYRSGFETWRNWCNTPWPFRDELRVGNSIEHSGYYINLFASLFGPAQSVTSFASTQVPNKIEGMADCAPDLSIGVITYHNKVVVRLTCSIVATPNHQVQFFGDKGTLILKSAMDYTAPICVRPNYSNQSTPKGVRARLAKRLPLRFRPFVDSIGIPLIKLPDPNNRAAKRGAQDFARGVNELAESIVQSRPCILSPDLGLHLNEIALALQFPEVMGSPRMLKTSFTPIKPPTPALT